MSDEALDEIKPDYHIHTDLATLKGNFLVGLQQLLDVLAISLSGLEHVDEEAYSNFTPFHKISPAHNRHLTRDAASIEAERWYLRTILRDAIELTNVFLEECWLVCSLFSAIKTSTITGEEYNRITGPDAKKFQSLGLPVKLKRLRDDFGVFSDLEPHVISINAVRACLTHRLGIVSNLDVDSSGELVILWRVLQAVAHHPDGTEEFVIDQPGIRVEAGWRIGVRITNKRKAFLQGERIELSYSEIAYTIFSLMNFAMTLVQSIQEHAKRVGIKQVETKM